MQQSLENSYHAFERTGDKTLPSTENLLKDIGDHDLFRSFHKNEQDRRSQQSEALIKDNILGNLQLFDSSISNPDKRNATETFKSGDTKASLEYDEKGQPKRFTDYNGDTIVREKDGTWTRKNIMGSEKVDLKVDKDGSVKITYKVDKDENDPSKGHSDVTRSIRRDGSVVTDYPNGVRTTMNGNGDNRIVKVEHNGKVTQTLKYKGDQIVDLTTSDGANYHLTGKDRNGKEHWTRISSDGKAEKFSGHVKVDRDGHVKIYNENARGTDHYVMRHFGDGTTVQSDETGKVRITKTANGLTIRDQKSEDGSLKRTMTYPDGRGRLEVSFDENGKAVSVKGKIGDREINYTTDPADKSGASKVASIESRKGNDSIFVENKDGSVGKIDGKAVESNHEDRRSAPSGRDLEQQTLVQEVPPGAEKLLEQRGRLLRHMSLPPLYFNALKMMYDLCKDGGAWDFKQMGGQYQKFGNFAYGFYTRALGMSEVWANRYPGWYKVHQGKSRNEWASTQFQNPADYRTTNAGRRYYDERQGRHS